MLEAHVRFELAHWTGDQAAASLAQEASSLYSWLGTVRLDQLLDPVTAEQILTDILCDGEFSDDLADNVVQAVLSWQATAQQDSTRLSDLVTRETYDRGTAVVVGLEQIRAEITLQVTTSEVYSQLMSHVLYQGIKNYLQSENIVAKKVPGAATLMRLGQNAVNSAAPKLEKSIDRQLTAFVNSNISDTIHDSRHYLDRVLDATVLGAVADEIWQTNANSTVADIAGLIPPESLEALVRTGWEALLFLRETPFLREVVHAAVEEFFSNQGARPVTELLADAGIDEQQYVQVATRLVGPALKSAGEDGFLEARIRARLEPFYDSLRSGATPQPRGARARATPRKSAAAAAGAGAKPAGAKKVKSGSAKVTANGDEAN